MDKNSILGIVLMAAIIIGFMLYNQPSPEELEQQRREAAEQQKLEQQKSDAEAVAPFDSISAAEAQTIAATVRELGTTDSLTHSSTLKIAGATLTAAADGKIGGTVEAGGKVFDVASLTAGSTLPAGGAEACKALRKALADAARYRGFAKYISGDSATVKLANKLVSLEISNKGAEIARAVLNDYSSYDSTAVEMMSPATNSYGFTLTTATQRFDTREFFFTPHQVGDSIVEMSLDLGDGATFAIRYTLLPDSYLVRMDVLQNGMQAVIPSTVASMDFSWKQKMPRNEAGRVFRNATAPYIICSWTATSKTSPRTNRKPRRSASASNGSATRTSSSRPS